MGRPRSSLVLAVVTTSACGAGGLDLIAPDLPDDVELVALVLETSEGSIARSTGLVRKTGAEFSATVEDLERAERARAFGFTRAQFDPPLPGDDALIESALVRGADTSDPRFPEPLWAGAGDIAEGLITSEPAPYRLTASWLPPCTIDPCRLTPIRASDRASVFRLGDERQSVGGATTWDLNRDSAFVITSTGATFRVDPNGATPISSATPPGAFIGAHLDGNGDIWILTGPAGILYRGRPESGYTAVAQMSSKPSKMVASDPSSPLEIFVVSEDDAAIERFDGTEWDLVYSGEPPVVGSGNTVDLVWIGPEHAAFTFTINSEIVTYDHGVVDVDRSVVSPRAIGYHPSTGLVLANHIDAPEPTTQLYLRTAEGWTLVEIPEEAGGFSSRHLWAMGQGLMYGGTRGSLAYYHPGLGSCASTIYGPRSNIDFIVPLQGGYLLAGGHTNFDLSVTWVDSVEQDIRSCD